MTVTKEPRLTDPDHVGAAEYRAIFDTLVDAEAITERGEVADAPLLEAMLAEFVGWAQYLDRDLRLGRTTCR